MQKKKIYQIIALATLGVLCLFEAVVGIGSLLRPSVSAAETSDYYEIGEIYQGAAGYNSNNIRDLYRGLTNNQCSTYKDLYAYSQSKGKINAKTIRQEIGKDLRVYFGEQLWDVVFFSNTVIDGNFTPVVTLWLHDILPASQMAWDDDNNNYDDSAIRAYLNTIDNPCADALIAPKDIDWQASGQNPYQVVNGYAINENHEATAAWRNDLIWLPSISETGRTPGVNNRGIGYWNLSVNQRQAADNMWTRSGIHGSDVNVYTLDRFGDNKDRAVTTSDCCIRPAIHINLNAAALTIPWAQDITRTYNGIAESETQPLLNNDNKTPDWLMPGMTFAYSQNTYPVAPADVINVGKYDVVVTRCDGVQDTLSLYITRKDLSVNFDRASYTWVYGDPVQLPQITPVGVVTRDQSTFKFKGIYDWPHTNLAGDVPTSTAPAGTYKLTVLNTDHNYHFVSDNDQGDNERYLYVTKRKLTYTGLTANKIYDGNKDAQIDKGALKFSSDLLSNDVGYVDLIFDMAQYESAAASDNCKVTFTASLGGSAGGNYELVNATNTTTGKIAKRGLTISGITVAKDKVVGDVDYAVEFNYDGVDFGNIISSDNNRDKVGVVATGNVTTINQGTQDVAIVLSLTGSARNNYFIADDSQKTAMVKVTPKTITLNSLRASKVYDGTDVLTESMIVAPALLDGITPGHQVQVILDLAFVDAAVGENKPLIIKSASLTGANAADYQINTANADLMGTITAYPLTISGIQALEKFYDGTDTVTFAYDTVQGLPDFDADLTIEATGNFVAIHANTEPIMVKITNLQLRGENAGNFYFTDDCQHDASALIKQRPLTITIDNQNSPMYQNLLPLTATIIDGTLANRDDVRNLYRLRLNTEQAIDLTVPGIYEIIGEAINPDYQITFEPNAQYEVTYVDAATIKPDPKPQKNNWLPIALGGGAIIIVLGGIGAAVTTIIIKKKKNLETNKA